MRCKIAKAAYDKRRRAEKSEAIRAYDRARNARRRKDPEFAEAQSKRKARWRTANRDKHLATSRAYDAEQLRTNLQRRLSKNLRHRLRKAMLGETRGISAVRDLGVSIEEFKAWIESKFICGMTWFNYGEWHLDHIKPLASFDLSVDAQVKAACNYKNIQPLWAKDNLIKGSRL